MCNCKKYSDNSDHVKNIRFLMCDLMIYYRKYYESDCKVDYFANRIHRTHEAILHELIEIENNDYLPF